MSAEVHVLPASARAATGVVAGIGIGALVGGGVWQSREPAWLGLVAAAMIGTAWSVVVVLRRRERLTRRLAKGAILPPTLLFSPTIFGVVPALLAGFVAWIVLLPLVHGVTDEPKEWGGVTAAWLVGVLLMALLLALVGEAMAR